MEPIRDRKKITQIKNQLRGQGRFRDLLLFTVGINTALRISDVLQLRIGQFIDEQQKPRSRFEVREIKTGKRHDVTVNDSIREALTEYLFAYPDVTSDPDNFVFFNSKFNRYSAALKRGRVWEFISAICEEVGLQGNYGTHSLRKTWGYQARMQGVDLALIMYKLNHASLADTKRYIGITDDEVEAVVKKLNL
ncbi:MAG: tyrosine-type recombinase/integrase [Chloroflexi bacterium]|nr:tyrosine-type recombinase/integrase [Chloroflexota bacterium]